MRKTLIALSLAASLFTGQAMADQATVANLQIEGIDLSTEQVATINFIPADDPVIVNVIGELITIKPEQTEAIVRASVKANPNLAEAIRAKATEVTSTPAPVTTNSLPSIGGSLGGSINTVNPSAAETADTTETPVTPVTPANPVAPTPAPISSLPSVDGSGGGGTNTASPN